MADINIQRKKSSPSPWLLILLVLAVIGVGAYLLLRADMNTTAQPAEEAELAETAPTTPATAPATDTVAAAPAEAESTTDAAPVTSEVLAAFAQGDASQPSYAREGLRLLTSTLVSLADRDDLRDPAISTRRDDLTSATSRLEEEGSSLRPGYVAATALMQAMQQKAYPELEGEVRALSTQAAELSGRATTAQDQQQLKAYLTQAAAVVEKLNQAPAR
ncbi:hypothetical protein [Hymenobacter weizhouensis]|uniref:hypothetical protein n=1 Tax=Hymenobacter sp. YIM 151500-1 TaxID=2987689 RepID=UPI00222696DF|nr:hypothetical protein [Hymenobacter sp. YIM 151500-1]UYZ61828.1 hypothetical protein OIS53_12535 [Hymenobacter sp. YIM 151500-1]